MSDSEANANQGQWLPFEFIRLGRHHMVKLINAEKLDLSLGFLRDSINAVATVDTIKIITLNNWLASQEELCEPKSSVSFISHVARCGSTLLCQNLKETKLFIVMGEPAFFHEIYGRRKENTPEGLRRAIASKAMTSWLKWAEKQGKRLVVKLSSALNAAYSYIRADFPSSKNLLLYREPVAVLESLSRKPSGLLKSVSDDAIKQLEFAANTYEVTLLDFTKRDNSVSRLVDYKHLGEEFHSIISFFSGYSECGHYLWLSEQYSKAKSVSSIPHYSPIEPKVVEDFHCKHKGLIDPLIVLYQTLPLKLGR